MSSITDPGIAVRRSEPSPRHLVVFVACATSVLAMLIAMNVAFTTTPVSGKPSTIQGP